MKEDRRECQICGRAIKAKSGVIAHHGYTRPGHGWGQTRSCAGARHLPYDVAHDVLDMELEAMAKRISEAEAAAAKFIAAPPAELKEIPRRSYQWKDAKTFQRPEGFDGEKEAASGSGRPGYQGLFVSTVWEDKRRIKAMKDYRAFIQTRRDNWKGPLQ
jgi:hypothetical protein